MTQGETPDSATGQPLPDARLVQYTQIIYGLHSLALLIGILSSATIVGSFVFGVPSIVAVIMNYVRRSDARGTLLESHFSWQIRTFWTAFGVIVVAGIFSFPLVFAFGLGIVTFAIAAFGTGLWVIYRVARGWLALRDGKAIA